MQVICIKLIYLNSPGSIEGIRRKMISISQCDQVVTISSHFAIGDVLSKDIALPEEMGGFMAYKTPATSHSRSQLSGLGKLAGLARSCWIEPVGIFGISR